MDNAEVTIIKCSVYLGVVTPSCRDVLTHVWLGLNTGTLISLAANETLM